ncbi:MAG TPA: hypothetical protein VHE35_00100 [Kofleriaceae bacterium]|nr:hypothetical protein [Kofleriaceae bacterium]
MSRSQASVLLFLLGGCGGGKAAPAVPSTPSTPSTNAAGATGGTPVTHVIALPGAPADGVSMDYIASEPARHRVWVPAGNTGSVDVLGTRDGSVHRIDGFPTAEVERHGMKRTVGPSSVTIGDGFAYVGNRADSKVCAIDDERLTIGNCVTLASMPDGLAYVAATHEVWVTTPRDDTVTILDVSDPATPKPAAVLTFDGQPEGYQVDEARGLFYTNFEDKDRTLQIDLRTRKTLATWDSRCGEDGPKGIALDRAHDLLVVACADHVQLVDAGHDGAIVSQVATGDGVDNVDYDEARHEVYAAAGHAGQLTIARLDPDRRVLDAAVVVPTHEGARNAVGDGDGDVYLTDTKEGAVLEVTRR